jgi:hypothetical protein
MNNDIDNILAKYKPISLSEMDSVKLMNRTDTKYFFDASLVPVILARSAESYYVLEIEHKRQFQYHTTYFDTCNFNLYKDHINGLLNRVKIRQRRYDITGVEFFEIKFKSNKNRTIKSRIENTCDTILNEKTDEFLKKKTSLTAQTLLPAIKNEFIRITLVNNLLDTRVTLDYNLGFSINGTTISLPNVGIAEIKRDGNSSNSSIISLLRELGQRPSGISKYCLGAALLYPTLKINSLKPKLLKINKLHHDCIDITRKH